MYLNVDVFFYVFYPNKKRGVIMPSVGGIQPIQPPQEEGPKKQVSQQEVEEFIKTTEDSKQLEQLLSVAHNRQSDLVQKDRTAGHDKGGIGPTLSNYAKELSKFEMDFFLSGFLNSLPNGDFRGSASSINNKINAEKNNGEKALKDVNSMISYIKNELAKPNLSPSERSKLESDLKGAQAVSQQLTKLIDLLSQLKAVPGKNPNECSIEGPTGWQKQLSQDESQVVNGNPSQDPPGGMVPLIAELESQWS